MNPLVAILFILASLGVVNGFIISTYLIFKKDKKISDLFFGGLLLVMSIRIGKSVLFYFDHDADRLILQIGLSACVFIGPFFYLYIKSVLKNIQQISRIEIILLLTLLLSSVIIGLLYPYRSAPEIWNKYLVRGIYAIWGIFVSLALYESRFILKEGLTSFRQMETKNRFVLIIVFAMVFITSAYQFALFIKGFTYIWGAVAFSFTFYYLMWRVLTNKPVAPKTTEKPELKNGKTLLAQVDSLMKGEKPFLNPKLKLDELSSQAGIPRHILSRVLNEVYPDGFSNYINAYRVREAKLLIATRKDLSLEGIGYESGFNSKSSFFTTFKKIANTTPAQYAKSLQLETKRQ